jgi:hypothetical protein
MDEDFDPSGIDGLWRMDRQDSKVRDPETGEWNQEPINEQIAEIRHDGDVMDFRCRIQHAPDLALYLRYRVRYGAEEWVPYEVFHIDGDPNHESLMPNLFRKVHARVGEPIAYLKEIYVDPRTTVRITKHPDGQAQYGLLSRLSEDRQRLVGKVFPVEGEAGISKAMVRDLGPAPEWPC